MNGFRASYSGFAALSCKLAKRLMKLHEFVFNSFTVQWVTPETSIDKIIFNLNSFGKSLAIWLVFNFEIGSTG